MIKTVDEIMTAVKGVIGDRQDDTCIALLEDLSDTLQDLSSGEDWKKKYEQNDEAWRKKYVDRFMSGSPAPDNEGPTPQENEDKKPLTFENLFKEG